MLKKLSSGEYWRQNDEISNTSMMAEGENPYPNSSYQISRSQSRPKLSGEALNGCYRLNGQSHGRG